MWVGDKLLKGGTKAVEEKVQAIIDNLRPKNLKEIRFFLGAINQIITFIPNSASLCAPLRPLLKGTKNGIGKVNMKGHTTP